MKKIIISFIILIINTTIFADFADIKTLKLKVQEKTQSQGREKVMSYKLAIKFPDLIYKEVLSPALNKGEKYIYKDDKKIVFIPLLQQYEEYEIKEQENQIFNVIGDIKNIQNKDIKNETDNNDNITRIIYDSGNEIVLEKYKKYGKISFPTEMVVLENKAILAKLYFSDIIINERIDSNLFQVEGQ